MSLVMSLLAIAVLTGIAAGKRHAWARRGITSSIPYPGLFAAQAAVALSAAWAIDHLVGPAAAIAAAAAAWLTVLAVATDLTCRKVPREIPHPVAAIGLAAAAVDNPGTHGWLSLATATVGLVVLPWIARALTRNGLGFGDIRLLWAWAATLSWWVGQTLLLYALIAACLLQLVVRLLARPLNLGTMVPVPAAPAAPPHTAPQRMRRELPFAPALALAFTAAVSYAAATGTGACHAWTATGVC